LADGRGPGGAASPGTASPTDPIVLDDVAVARGGKMIWSRGTMAIRARSIVAAIGPNGSGKTTLLEALLGLVPVARGHIEIFGRPPRRGEDRIGYVPQNDSATIGEAVRARDLVALGLAGRRWGLGRLSPTDRARITATLDAVGAGGFADRRMSELSGGQRQRVAIAQALVGDPEILLLDEPLANLDLRNQREIVDVLSRLRIERGVTIVIVAHDLNPLLSVLDGAIYLLDGHAHYGAVGDVVDEELLTHLYGTQVRVVRTATGDLFTRSAP
jgi:zinc/manganese transport system ATP-binding protein